MSMHIFVDRMLVVDEQGHVYGEIVRENNNIFNLRWGEWYHKERRFKSSADAIHWAQENEAEIVNSPLPDGV